MNGIIIIEMKATTNDMKITIRKKLLKQKPRTRCIYCEFRDYATKKCTLVLNIASGREILRKKGVCFNCTSASVQVSHLYDKVMHTETTHIIWEST